MGIADDEHEHEGTERVRKALERDFEAFMSMAAHNLREPLREVAAFSQLMAENYAGRLDADAGVLLDRIQQGAKSMQSLLADMVDFSAAGGARELSSTDMEGVLAQALLLAEKQIAERSAILTRDPLPTVTGNFAVLTKVLHHLIRNAIGYSATPPPRIHISSKRWDNDWVFSVHDNGPGIDPAFHGRMFVAFKRLHGRDYPGNGLGLAYCKKAMEGLGGRMWLDSTAGAGSTFYFAIPQAD